MDGVSGGVLVWGVECPPMPNSFWMKFWGLSDIWLQVLTGAVPSRKAALKALLGQVESAKRLVALSMRATVTPSDGEKDLTSEYWGSLIARFMNSAHMGAAASAPWSACVSPREISV